MGYSEFSCQICAVSFNLARLRTKHEPAEEGWGYSGGFYYMLDAPNDACSLYPEQSGCENIEIDHPAQELHLPGRGCVTESGFSGWRISAEEMKGVRFPRYIVNKPKNFDAEKEEQPDYERESDFFVSAQTTEAPDDFETGNLSKIRFGVDWFIGQNYDIGVAGEDEHFGVPVHAHCWEIFERVCRLRLGAVDLQGFMALWWREACCNCGFSEMPQDPSILECKQQGWMHKVGTEYLGANPLKIPGFMIALHTSDMTHLKGPDVFLDKSSAQDHENSSDKFRVLPPELRAMILDQLSSKDIASLRSVSRAFHAMSKKFFHQLIHKELPWFWEEDELIKMNDEWYDRIDDKLVKKIEREEMNWHVLYKGLSWLKKTKLGLKNRVRIWNLAEEIVQRISILRYDVEEGGELEVCPDGAKNGFYCLRCNIKHRGRT